MYYEYMQVGSTQTGRQTERGRKVSENEDRGNFVPSKKGKKKRKERNGSSRDIRKRTLHNNIGTAQFPGSQALLLMPLQKRTNTLQYSQSTSMLLRIVAFSKKRGKNKTLKCFLPADSISSQQQSRRQVTLCCFLFLSFCWFFLFFLLADLWLSQKGENEKGKQNRREEAAAVFPSTFSILLQPFSPLCPLLTKDLSLFDLLLLPSLFLLPLLPL